LLRKSNKLYSINQNEEVARDIYHAFPHFASIFKCAERSILRKDTANLAAVVSIVRHAKNMK
jgi:hypothetical protein